MSTTTLTPNPIPLLTDSMLADYYFNGQPGFPHVRRPAHLPRAPILNKVYFSKKTLQQTLKRYDVGMQQNEIAQVWQIPFSVDVNEPVTELTQKIQAVMTAKKIYKHWDINFSNFTILAKQVTYEWDTVIR